MWECKQSAPLYWKQMDLRSQLSKNVCPPPPALSLPFSSSFFLSSPHSGDQYGCREFKASSYRWTNCRLSSIFWGNTCSWKVFKVNILIYSRIERFICALDIFSVCPENKTAFGKGRPSPELQLGSWLEKNLQIRFLHYQEDILFSSFNGEMLLVSGKTAHIATPMPRPPWFTSLQQFLAFVTFMIILECWLFWSHSDQLKTS